MTRGSDRHRRQAGTHRRRRQFSINNDPGGYWTQAEYVDVVNYAAAHFMTVIPEVDSPGHNNAIIMSYAGPEANPYLPDVNCSNRTPPQWNLTGAVGYSAMCPESPNTWAIITDIVSQLSAMTPGPYYHLGGDEVPARCCRAPGTPPSLTGKRSSSRHRARSSWAGQTSPRRTSGQPGSPQAVAQFWSNGSPTGAGGDTARVAVQEEGMQVRHVAGQPHLPRHAAVHRQSAGAELGRRWTSRTSTTGRAAPATPSSYIPARTTGGVTLPAVTDANILGVEAPPGPRPCAPSPISSSRSSPDCRRQPKSVGRRSPTPIATSPRLSAGWPATAPGGSSRGRTSTRRRRCRGRSTPQHRTSSPTNERSPARSRRSPPRA